MKKAIVLFILLNVSGAFAQSKLRLGVNLDPLATWFSPVTKGIEKDGARPGLSGGLIVEYYFRPNYGFVTGLNITALGGNLMYNDSVYISTGSGGKILVRGGSTVVYHVNYLTVPIALKLKTNEIGYFTYYAQLGLTQQINISSRGTATKSGLSKENVSKEFNLLGMSYFFGGGIEYNIGGETSLTFGIFYNHGFTDVLSNDNHKAYLNYLTFRVGVLF